MGDKTKRLCKWKKDDYGERLDELQAIVSAPRFVCTRCGRAAVAKKWLCKPKPLSTKP